MMTAQCVTRDQLEEYLSGWTAPEQSEAIEAHLLECPACEQAVAKLEGGSDTFLDSVRRSQTQLEPADAPSAESQLATALERAKHGAEPAETFDEQLPSSAGPIAQVDIGSYELLRPIGHGGMGSVYLARHRQLGKQLAIKLLSTKLNRNGGYTARFQREMRAAGGLDHPSIVRATDAGEHDGTHYLAMEYIDGLDLSRIAHLVGKFSVADACEIARQVALGLSHAHATGVTHRDIKPSNIMLSTAGQVKILDFGLARLNLWDEVSAELTTVGQLIGTLDYMAPEQADRPESVDYRADLYALGATLFRLLCGRAPLAASPEMSPLAKLRLLATHQPPSLKTLRPDAPEPLVRLVASLLARDPESRPASAAHVAEELAAFTQGADLPALVNRAQTCAPQEPEELTAELASESLRRLRKPDGEASDGAAAGSKPPRSTVRTLAWAFAPLAIVAGVLITLETQKGNLVIESEVANVSVKLLRDGKPYDQLKIEPGATSTRLYAGQYEVTIDGGSDSLVVDQGRIDVRRGETSIARIRQQPAEAAGTGPHDQAARVAPPATDQAAEIASLKQRLAELQGTSSQLDEEPLFNGKQLSYWLATIGRERSSERYTEALVALQTMLTPDNAQRIASALLPALRSRPTARKNALGDDLAFSILRKAHPGKRYYELLAHELETGSEEWHARVLYSLTLVPPDEIDTIEPVTEWLEKNVFAEGGRKGLLSLSTSYYERLIRSSDVAEVKQRFSSVLVNCAALDDAYWLARPTDDPNLQPSDRPSATAAAPTQRYVPWYPPIAEHIEQIAIRTLASDQADRKLVTQAIIILRVLNSGYYDRTGMQDRRSEAIEASRSALRALESKPALFNEEQKVSSAFFFYIERWGPILVLSPRLDLPRRVDVNYNLQERMPVALTAVELLELIKELVAGTELAGELVGLMDATSELSAELYAKEPVGFLTWPQWQLVNPNTNALAQVSREEWLAAYLHSTAYSLLPEEKQIEVRDAAVRKYKATVEETRKEIGTLDTDGDGNLSIEEAKDLFGDPQKIDVNSDGLLSPDELIEFRARQRWAKRADAAKPEAASPVAPQGPGRQSTAPGPQGAVPQSFNQPSAVAAPAAGDESIYQGKPLSYWLDAVGRERNAESYVEALNALRGMLTSTANAQRITAVLLPVLRSQATFRTDSQGHNLDFAAFAVLSNANPDEKFYELLTHELQTGTPAWQSRIFKALEHTPDDPKATAPLTTWLEE